MERSNVVGGMSWKGRNKQSSEGIDPELLMIMTCCNEGTTDEGVERDNEGKICFNKGIWDRVFNFGVVMNIFVP